MKTHRKPDLLWMLFLFISAGVTISTIAQAEERVAVTATGVTACHQSMALPRSSVSRTETGMYKQLLAMFADKLAACQAAEQHWEISGKQNRLGLSLARPGVRYGRSIGGLHAGLTLTADDRGDGVQPLLWVGVQGRW